MSKSSKITWEEPESTEELLLALIADAQLPRNPQSVETFNEDAHHLFLASQYLVQSLHRLQIDVSSFLHSGYQALSGKSTHPNATSLGQQLTQLLSQTRKSERLTYTLAKRLRKQCEILGLTEPFVQEYPSKFPYEHYLEGNRNGE